MSMPLSFLPSFFDEIKLAIMDYLEKVRKNVIFIGFPGFLFISKTIPFENRHELVYVVNNVSKKSGSVSIGPYKGYIEIRKFGKGENAIYDAVLRITEKVDTYIKWVDHKGKSQVSKLSGEVIHVFSLKINLRDNLISFAFGMHNKTIGEVSYYRPLERSDYVIKMHGFMNYEQKAGFYAFIKEDIILNILRLLVPVEVSI